MINNEQRSPPVRATPTDSFQGGVQPWMMACFGAEISADGAERNHRFLEESLELVQACGCTASEAYQLVDYVYGRPVGERAQEVGGVMVTLAALCLAQGLDMHAAGETELARIWTKVEAIRAKQAAKPKHSPLPAAAPQVVRLAFGHLDFQVDAGMACEQGEEELLPMRMALVLASRRAGIGAAVDGVTVDTRNPERLAHDAARARRMGFGGKLCIHPAQVQPLHAVFDPDPAAVTQAQRLCQALAEAGGGVCVLDGRMVDAPVLHLAQQTLARHAWALQRMHRNT